MEPRVLIVGAGPTGLVLAQWLARLGVAFRIVEKNSGPGQACAMVVQARTLEFYRQLGFASEVIQGGIILNRLHLREGTREIAAFEFGGLGKGLSPYPFALSYPQDDHERMLLKQLNAVGHDVEWNTELVRFSDEGQRISATLRRNGAEEACEVAYLCGCDGAHSTVRQGLNLDFPGGTYGQMFFVADVAAEVDFSRDDINFCLDEAEFCAVFPIRSTGTIRLIGMVPQELGDREDISFEDVRPYVQRVVGVDVRVVNWFARYRVHHRVAEHFRAGRVFIAGDAGHIHSPVGGQGMNTGIGDAVNLGWKLAGVLQHRLDESVLGTYESERFAFARSLVATTDKAFKGIVGGGIARHVFRSLIFPHVIPFALGFTSIRKAQFRLISQTRINYRGSALSEGSVRAVHGGDRLPWVEAADNFKPMESLDWQIHIYGTAGEPLKDAAKITGIAVCEFKWDDAMDEAGLKADAMYLVRPDGYVALVDSHQDVEALTAFLARFKIAPRRIIAVRHGLNR